MNPAPFVIPEPYIIVQDRSASALAYKVNEKIREGYAPIGGPMLVFGLMMQAMVREE